jgi:tRNA A-37 threonylcarbamoyl transferase component Bud32
VKPGALTGSVLGNYRLAELLDEGGVGSVYVSEHRFLGEKAAVKVLQQQPLMSNREEITRRFFQEARATRSIDHPNVVKVNDFGQTDDGTLYLAMELLDGVSIVDVLRRGAIEERAAAFIAASVASGLQAAHEKGIIHRDLKPGNIFLCSNGRVKLLDFGMAKVTEGPLRTGVGMIVGTPQYMSPEQIRQESNVGPRADVYGLGAVLYRMLTRRLPFESESLHEIVKMHLNAPPPRPSGFAQVSSRMDEIVLACMQKDPARRPASMLALRDLLLPIADQAGAGGGSEISGQARGELVARPETDRALRELARSPAEAKGPAPGAPRRSSPSVTVGLSIVIGLLGSAFVVLKPWARPRSAPPPTAPVRAVAPAPPPTTTLPADAFSVLKVESDPPGAQVFVDHMQKGVAPLELTVPIPFELKLELEGYKTIRRKITKAEPVRIKLWPKADPGRLPPPPAQDSPGRPPAGDDEHAGAATSGE